MGGTSRSDPDLAVNYTASILKISGHERRRMERGYGHMEIKTCKIWQKDAFLSRFFSPIMDAASLEVKR